MGPSPLIRHLVLHSEDFDKVEDKQRLVRGSIELSSDRHLAPFAQIIL